MFWTSVNPGWCSCIRLLHPSTYRQQHTPLPAALQGQALQVDMQNTKVTEEVKLASSRCAAATAQLAEMQQQLSAVRAENTSLRSELDQSSARETAAAAAQEQLQQTAEGLQNDLRRYVTLLQCIGLCQILLP